MLCIFNSINFNAYAVIKSAIKIKTNYIRLKDSFPYARIYYAMKANPGEPVIQMLAEMGSCFDIASRYELDMISKFDVSPDRLSYGNTIKKPKDIKYFYEKGVRMFATDSKDDLKAIAENAPGSRIYVRILVENSVSADWPLSRKFGCHPDMAYDLLVLARDLGLTPYGISFHVGSQQRDIGQWNDAIAKVKYLFTSLEEEEGIRLSMINMGGGFPASYVEPTNTLSMRTARSRWIPTAIRSNSCFRVSNILRLLWRITIRLLNRWRTMKSIWSTRSPIRKLWKRAGLPICSSRCIPGSAWRS